MSVTFVKFNASFIYESINLAKKATKINPTDPKPLNGGVRVFGIPVILCLQELKLIFDAIARV